jgi:hypothetical protein
MKKNLMLLMLCVGFSFAAIASNDVRKGKAKVEQKVKPAQKTTDGFCFAAVFYSAQCPDGSSYTEQIDFYLTDCESGTPFVGQTIYLASVEESC